MLNIDQSLENASYRAYPAKLQKNFTSVFGNNYKTTGIDTVLKSCINLLRNPASYFFFYQPRHMFSGTDLLFQYHLRPIQAT